jgi:hypothetical protein
MALAFLANRAICARRGDKRWSVLALRSSSWAALDSARFDPREQIRFNPIERSSYCPATNSLSSIKTARTVLILRPSFRALLPMSVLHGARR